MGPAEFGLFALIAGVLAVSEMVCEQALSQTIVQTQMTDQRELSTLFYFALVIGAFGTVGLLICGLNLNSIFDSREAPRLLTFAAICPLIISTTVVPIGLLRKQLNFKALAKRTVLASGISSAVGVTLVVQGYGAEGLVAQSILYYAIGAAILWKNCHWNPGAIASLTTIKPVARLALANTGSKMLDLAETRGVEMTIGAIAGVEALGIYAFASKVAQTAFQILVSPVLEVIFSGIARSKDHFLASLRHGQLIIASIPTAGLLFLAIAAHPLLTIAYGDRWRLAAGPLTLLAVAYGFRSFLYCYGIALQAVGQSRMTLQLSALRVGICLTLCIGFLVVQQPMLVALAYLMSATAVFQTLVKVVAAHSMTSKTTLVQVPKFVLIALTTSSVPVVIIYSLNILPPSQSIALLFLAFFCVIIYLAIFLKLGRNLIQTTVLTAEDGNFSSLIRKINVLYAPLPQAFKTSK